MGLSGRSDEEIFAAAWDRDRILLTHDDDFLDDRRFPGHRNPGLIVIRPGAQGNDDRRLLRCLGKATSLIGAWRELWRGAKIDFRDDENVVVASRNLKTGVIEKNKLKFPKDGPALEWVDE